MEGDVSRETTARLNAFREIFHRWAPAVNLVSPSTIASLEERHIADSAQIAQMAPETAQTWTDLGTGGGFPGLIIAALQAETHPNRRFTLIESDQRKCTFLRQAAKAMNLDVQVVTSRIEDAPPLRSDVVSARALAPLEHLCAYAQRHLALDGLALFMKGENYAAEVLAARHAGWAFDLAYKASTTQPGSVIIMLKNIVRH